jgi:hypothetical protein
MYGDFQVVDPRTGKSVRCTYQALILAIATRHADAVDVKFLVDGNPVWIALPHTAWDEYRRRTGRAMSDPMAVEVAGHFLKSALAAGAESEREFHTLTLAETMKHVEELVGDERLAAHT